MGLLIFALLSGALLLLVAAFRFSLGAPVNTGFWKIFLTPVLVAARFAGQSSPFAAFWLAGGAILACALLCVLAILLNRRMPDVIFNALLAFQLFFVARVLNTFLSPAGAPTWPMLSTAQKLNLVTGLLLLIAVWLAWAMRPKPATPYQSSAPSRITKFLKKRRLPSRVLGAILMAFAVACILFTSHLAFWQGSAQLTPFRAILAFVVCDAIYFSGKKFWLRLT